MADPDLLFDRAVILGATGPTGIHLAEALRSQGVSLRLVSRSPANLQRTFGETHEHVAADARKADEVKRAIEGCPLAFDCIGLPADLMDQHPVTARNIARAMQEAGARCVQVSSFWAYLPLSRTPLTEDHPRVDGNDWIRYRRSAEDILLEAGAAVLHLPDFYGPHAHTSTLQQPLGEAAQGRVMNWIGSPDTEREYVYVPDAMKVAARVSTFAKAYGQHWIVPGSGPLSGKQVAEIAGGVLGHKVRVRGAGLTTLRIVSLFNKPLRGFLKMVPEYLKPIAYDASKLRGLLGEIPTTSYKKGIQETLAWLRR